MLTRVGGDAADVSTGVGDDTADVFTGVGHLIVIYLLPFVQLWVSVVASLSKRSFFDEG